MNAASKKSYGFIRTIFGFIWAFDAILKWNPVFLNNFSGELSSAAQGQPAFISEWINIWAKVTNYDPHLFAILVALTESVIAICLILNILPRITLIVGFVFSLLIWSTAEGFGGPYMSGSVDVGAALIYALAFAMLWFWKYSD